MNNDRIWVVSELYYPETTSTGHSITGIAEGLAEQHDVRVICAQPTYANRGIIAARHEQRNGVTITRCSGTRFDKDRLALRAINTVSFGLAAFFQALIAVRRRDRVLVLTNPPLLPFLLLLACRLRGAHMTLLIHDLYPDVLFQTGMLRSESWIGRLSLRATRLLFEHCAQIVVLGRDMQRAVVRRAPVAAGKVRVIPNFAGLNEIQPKPQRESIVAREHGLAGSFVAQYLGNMGRTHDIESIVAAAEQIGPAAGVEFLMGGWGAKRPWLESHLAGAELSHVHLVRACSRAELTEYLSAATIALIAFLPGMAGLSVPSRLYDIMAAARPVIAMCDADAELALVLEEERIGWVVQPGDVRGLAQLLVRLAAGEAPLEEMGQRARRVAEAKYSRAAIDRQYARLFAAPARVGASMAAATR